MTLTRRRLSVTVLAGLLAAAPAARAQFTVYDPTNYAQNVLQAARALESVNNQIAGLQNQAQMLVGQARSLASLPYSSLAALQAQLDQTRGLLGQAQGLAYDVQSIQDAFQGRYGAPALSASQADLTARADERWSTAIVAFEDALKVQAGVVGGMGASRDQLAGLIGSSQGAVGGLQAAQAGNQLLALQSQQLADLIALNAAQGRAQALEAADRAAARADAKVRFSKFMGDAPRP
jgi:P-type conjugative transfer protein TrbJ